MTFTIRPAVTEAAKPLVGMYAESGNGKTYSALLLAKGYVEAMGGTMADVVMIETEAGRGEAFADDPVVGGYQVIRLWEKKDFSPTNYGGAIDAAEAGKAKACIVDSASHEWEGVGGVLDWAGKNAATGAKGVLVWQKPKISHQKDFVGRLMQTPIPLVISCMRAKYPMKEATAEDVERISKTGARPPKKGDWFRSDKLEPKQADDFLFEMFVHGWIDEAHNFRGTKYTTRAMRDIFLDGKPITVETGQRLYAWAKGRAQKTSAAPSGSPDGVAGQSPTSARIGSGETSPPGEASASPAGVPPIDGERDALLVKGREFAECGLNRYLAWIEGLTQDKRTLIGKEQHIAWKKIATEVGE